MKGVEGILFSGSKENADLAVNHCRKHGIVYWSLPVPFNYAKYHFPIKALLHIKGAQVGYECIINDAVRYSPTHFKDPKKKPEPWVKGWKAEKRRYKVTFAISRMAPFTYKTSRLKKLNGTTVANPPQGYAKIIIPKRAKR